MSRDFSRRTWIVLLVLGLIFLVTNSLDGDWYFIPLAAFVVVFSGYRLLRPRPAA